MAYTPPPLVTIPYPGGKTITSQPVGKVSLPKGVPTAGAGQVPGGGSLAPAGGNEMPWWGLALGAAAIVLIIVAGVRSRR